MFFYLLVSDHVVTLLCLSVTVDFFDFPIDFLWGLNPFTVAAEVLCAAFRATRTPPYTNGVSQKSQNGETLYKCIERFF